MTMIEKMARAIFGSSDDEWNSLPDTKADWRKARYPDCRYKDDFRDDARAALAALLEPDEVLFAAVIAEPVHLYDDGLRGADYQRDMKAATIAERMTLASRFREVIQAALDEPALASQEA